MSDFRRVYGLEQKAWFEDRKLTWKEKWLFEPTNEPAVVSRHFIRDVFTTPKFVRWETDYKGDYGKYVLYEEHEITS